MSDLKGMYQEKAEELADQVHGVDFHDLSDEQQGIIYQRAMESVDDKLSDQADSLIDMSRGL